MTEQDSLPSLKSRIAGFQKMQAAVGTVTLQNRVGKFKSSAFGAANGEGDGSERRQRATTAGPPAVQSLAPAASPTRTNQPAASPTRTNLHTHTHQAKRETTATPAARTPEVSAPERTASVMTESEEVLDRAEEERLMQIATKVATWWKWRSCANCFDMWVVVALEKGTKASAPVDDDFSAAIHREKKKVTRTAAPGRPLSSTGENGFQDACALVSTATTDVFVSSEQGCVTRQGGGEEVLSNLLARATRSSPSTAETKGARVVVDPCPPAMRKHKMALEVVACPSAAVLGRNRVYLPTAVHVSIAKMQASQIGSVHFSTTQQVLIGINGVEYEAWCSPDLRHNTVALDSVQAFSVRASLGEKVDVWPLDMSAGLCSVQVCSLVVRLKDKSSAVGFTGLDKNKFSEHCFQVLQGQPLAKGQDCMIGFGYWRLALTVERAEDPWSSNLVVFHCGKHPRLGARCWVSMLPPKVLAVISKVFWEDACRTSLVGPSSRLDFNFWNGANYDGKRSAEGVSCMGQEQVLIRSGFPESPSPNLQASNSPTTRSRHYSSLYDSGNSQAARSRPAQSLYSSLGFSEPAKPQTIMALSPELAFSAVPSGPGSHTGASPYSSPHVAASSSPYTSPYIGHSNAPVSRSPPPRSPSVRFVNAPSSGPNVGFAHAPGSIRFGHPIPDTQAVAGQQALEKTKKGKLIRDMLLNASLEHEETLLQLDEMSTIAAASLQRENKFVKMVNNVVHRNQAKGGDWTHLAHVLQDYSDEVHDILLIVEKQQQRQAYHAHTRQSPRQSPRSGAAPGGLYTVEEGMERSALRTAASASIFGAREQENDLQYAREAARTRANEAQQIHEMALAIPHDTRKSSSASPTAGNGRGKPGSTLFANGGEIASQMPPAGQSELPEQDRGGSGRNLETREAQRAKQVAERAKELKHEISSSAQNGTALSIPPTIQTSVSTECVSRSLSTGVAAQGQAAEWPKVGYNSDDLPNPYTSKVKSTKANEPGNRTAASLPPPPLPPPGMGGLPPPPPPPPPPPGGGVLCLLYCQPSTCPAWISWVDVMVGILKSQLLRILYVYSVFSTHHLYSAGLVEIDWGGQKCKTTFKKQDYDPVWNEDFPFTFEESTKSKGVEDLVLGVKDWGVTALTGYDHVGEIIIPSKTLNQLVWHSKNETMEQFADLPVIDKNGKQIVGKDGQLCELTFEIKVFVDSETSQADSDLLVINKARPLTSRSAAPGPKTPPIVTESLNQVEKQMMDQLDDDLQALALSGTLPLEVQNAINSAIQKPDGTNGNSRLPTPKSKAPKFTDPDSRLTPPLARTTAAPGKLNSPFLSQKKSNASSANAKPQGDAGGAAKQDVPEDTDEGGGSVFGRPSASQLLQKRPRAAAKQDVPEDDAEDGGSVFGRPSPAQLLQKGRTAAGTRSAAPPAAPPAATLAVAKPETPKDDAEGGSSVFGRPSPAQLLQKGHSVGTRSSATPAAPGKLNSPFLSQENSNASPANAKAQGDAGGAAKQDVPEDTDEGGGSVFGRPSASQLLQKRPGAAAKQDVPEDDAEDGGSVFGRPSPAQLLQKGRTAAGTRSAAPPAAAANPDTPEDDDDEEGGPLFAKPKFIPSSSSSQLLNDSPEAGSVFKRPTPAQLLAGIK